MQVVHISMFTIFHHCSTVIQLILVEKQGDVGHTSYLQSFMKQNVINNDELVIRKALNLTGRQARQKSLCIQCTQFIVF